MAGSRAPRKRASGMRACAIALAAAGLAGCAQVAALLPDAESRHAARESARFEAMLQQQRERRAAQDEPSSGPQQTVDELLRTGDGLLRSGQRSKAALTYLRAHYRDASRAEPLERIAALGVLEDPQRSAELFRKLREQHPEDPELLLGLGSALLAGRDLSSALESLESARALAPGSPEIRAMLGVGYDRAARREEAQAEYRAALDARPGDARVQNNLGVSLMLSGRFDEAVEVLKGARGSDAGDRAIANNLGMALALAGRRGEALAAFQAHGSRGDALNNLGYALLLANDLPAARQNLEQALLASDGDDRRILENLRLVEAREQQLRAERPELPAAPAAAPPAAAPAKPRAAAPRRAPAPAPRPQPVEEWDIFSDAPPPGSGAR